MIIVIIAYAVLALFLVGCLTVSGRISEQEERNP